MKEEQNLVRSQTVPRQHFDSEEIDSSQDRHMRTDEVFPVCVLAALRRRSDAVTAKDVAYRLIGNNLTEVGQCSDNPIVTSTRVLSRHLDHQLHALALPWRPTWIRALSGTIELLSDQPAVPGKYSFANFAERGPLRIRQA
jgi:hypothetical protein